MSNVVWVESLDELKDIVSSNDEVVVEWTAPSWCAPCRAFAPHFDMASEKSTATFVAVSLDNLPDAQVECDVMTVPTVRLYRDGDFVKDLKSRKAVQLLAEIE